MEKNRNGGDIGLRFSTKYFNSKMLGGAMRRYAIISFLVIVALSSATFLRADEFRWKKVDDAKIAGQYKALMLDSAGLPHIIYWDQTEGFIKYAYKDECRWQSSTIPTPQDGSVYSAVMDDSSSLHFIFKGVDGQDTLYYCRRKGEWEVEVVDHHTGTEASMAVDSGFRPHVVYYSESDHSLIHASKDGSVWQYDTVGLGINPSLALDNNDGTHIAYQVPDEWTVKYAGTETIDTAVGPGGIPSLATDSENSPHISCLYLGATRKLRYYHWDGDQWQFEDIDSLGRIGPSDLVLSSSDSPHIAYKTDRALKHASLSATWQIQQIDTTVMTNPSLQLSKLDNPHVCYDSGTYNFLMYAWVPDSQYVKICVNPDSFYFVYGSYTSQAPAEDGNMSGCFQDLNDPMWMEAVQLSVVVPCSLTELLYYPCNPQHPALHWKVWGDDDGRPGALLREGIAYPTTSDEWVGVSIDPYIALDPGPVYVGWSVAGPPHYYNGHDAVLEEQTNWWWNGAAWVRDRYIPGNLLIRAILWIPEAHPTDTIYVLNDGYQIDLDVDSISYRTSWIEFVSQSLFSLPHDSVQSVEFGVNAEGLPRGIYADTLIIHSNDGNTPAYRIPIVFQVDTIMTRIEEEIETRPLCSNVTISLIRPNPMKDAAVISYSIARRDNVSLKIYNSLGALVRTLVDETTEQGSYTSIWDGKDSAGREVAPGVYWSILQITGSTQARKVVVLR